jgi:hypothetical protein
MSLVEVYVKNNQDTSDDKKPYITYYDQMPIPAVEENTEIYSAGSIAIGVQFRVLTDERIAGLELETASGGERGKVIDLDDQGVALHVFTVDGSERTECLRFDCFDDDPHYHFVNWGKMRNEMVHLDPVAHGDGLTWALKTIKERLPQMIDRALGQGAGAKIDLSAVEKILPLVTEAAFRARFQ